MAKFSNSTYFSLRKLAFINKLWACELSVSDWSFIEFCVYCGSISKGDSSLPMRDVVFDMPTVGCAMSVFDGCSRTHNLLFDKSSITLNIHFWATLIKNQSYNYISIVAKANNQGVISAWNLTPNCFLFLLFGFKRLRFLGLTSEASFLIPCST